MPNGYTAPIYEGEDISTRDYIMRVGRAFGFAILQRDDSLDDPVKVPERRVSSFYSERLAGAVDTLIALNEMSAEDCERAAQSDFTTDVIARIESRAKMIRCRLRYAGMAARVEAWTPPEGLTQVKDHALNFLIESDKADNGLLESERYGPPQLLAGAEWHDQKRERAIDDLERMTDYIIDDLTRETGRADYAEGFLESLPS